MAAQEHRNYCDLVCEGGGVKGCTRHLPPLRDRQALRGKASTFSATAALRKILAYFNLGSNLGSNLTDWRNWLANNGPIMARLDVDSTWDDASFTGGNLDAYNPNSTRGGQPSRSSATPPAASSFAMAGARAGATRGSPTRRWPTRRRLSRRPMA
ncbi:MAG TPA: hypothetical protein VK273_02200 [Gaiellaceae bacterium]|nr:hypothetical protein [Gaiellaceae bacterium]